MSGGERKGRVGEGRMEGKRRGWEGREDICKGRQRRRTRWDVDSKRDWTGGPICIFPRTGSGPPEQQQLLTVALPRHSADPQLAVVLDRGKSRDEDLGRDQGRCAHAGRDAPSTKYPRRSKRAAEVHGSPPWQTGQSRVRMGQPAKQRTDLNTPC